MKKFTLIGIFLSLFNLILLGSSLSGTASSNDRTDAINKAQTELRKELVVYINELYRNSLKEYFLIFENSRQNVDKQTIDRFISMSKTEILSNKAPFKYSFSINKTQITEYFNNNLEDINAKRLSNNNETITSLLISIDKDLLNPKQNNLDLLLNDLKLMLSNKQIICHDKYLSINDEPIIINVYAPENMNAVVDYNFNNKYITKNSVEPLQISFDSKKVDININDRKEQYEIKYKYNIEKSYPSLKHSAFFQAFFMKYLQGTEGSILIQRIFNTKFILYSENFNSIIPIATETITKKGWLIGTAEDYTHLLVINKQIIDERKLNIGVLYIKGYLSITYYDKDNQIVKIVNTPEIECIDNSNFETLRIKFDNMLLKEIEKI
jgi:hypothetical protein